ncbi:MAG TPA: flagellar biosynthetic protein FliR [Phycisphaerales bacterium]|nr:flagellar biosynthetic protein FliR [Phycisphaerales bacterium]
MELLLAQLVPLVLVAFRLSGLFVFAPMISGITIPIKVKVLLCLIMGVGLFGLVRPAAQPVPPDFFSFAAMAVGEVIIGSVIGLLALIPVVAVQLGGVIMGQQMGLSLATVFDPSTESDSEVMAQMLLYVALLVFVLFGGLDTLFLAVAKSFANAPLGGFAWGDHAGSALKMIVGMIGSGMELALRVSTPVLGIIFVETIASGMVMKTMPQMNIMSIGFGLKVLLGIGAVILSFYAISDAVSEHVMQGGRLLFAWPPAPLPAEATNG